MIASRALSTLIRLNHVIKLSTFTNPQLPNSSRYLVKKLSSEKFLLRTMHSNIEEEMNDPKRHFDYKQLVAKKDEKNVVVIDVREHSEINETGKIPGSIHIPLNELKKALNDDERFSDLYKSQKPKIEDEVIFTCRSGRRSLTAMRIAYECGYQKAGNYKGGWLDWAEKSGQSK